MGLKVLVQFLGWWLHSGRSGVCESHVGFGIRLYTLVRTFFFFLLQQGSWWLGLLCWDAGGLRSSVTIGVAALQAFRDWACGGWVRVWEGSDPIHFPVVDSCRSSFLSLIWPSSVAIRVGHGLVWFSRGFPTYLRRGFLCRKWVRSLMWSVLGIGVVVGCWPLRLLMATLSVIGSYGF